MWIIGTVALLIIGGAITAAIGWMPRATPGEPVWDIARLASGNTGHYGTFAGFSLAATTFIAGLDAARTSPMFAVTFGMMLIGFLILVLAAFIGNSVPSTPESQGTTTQSLALVLANTCGTLGVSVTLLALAPLVVAIGMPALADTLVWWLLVMVFATAIWVALVAYRLTMASVRGCLTVAVLGPALPIAYRLAARLWPELWPTSEPALHFAFVALGAAFLLLALQMGLLVAHSAAVMQGSLTRNGHRLVLAASQALVAMVMLIWFDAANP